MLATQGVDFLDHQGGRQYSWRASQPGPGLGSLGERGLGGAKFRASGMKGTGWRKQDRRLVGRGVCPQCQAGGGAFLLEQRGLTGSCDVLMRVCDKIPLAAAGWGRAAGVGVCKARVGWAFLRFGAPREGRGPGELRWPHPELYKPTTKSQARVLDERWAVPGVLDTLGLACPGQNPFSCSIFPGPAVSLGPLAACLFLSKKPYPCISRLRFHLFPEDLVTWGLLQAHMPLCPPRLPSGLFPHSLNE